MISYEQIYYEIEKLYEEGIQLPSGKNGYNYVITRYHRGYDDTAYLISEMSKDVPVDGFDDRVYITPIGIISRLQYSLDRRHSDYKIQFNPKKVCFAIKSEKNMFPDKEAIWELLDESKNEPHEIVDPANMSILKAFIIKYIRPLLIPDHDKYRKLIASRMGPSEIIIEVIKFPQYSVVVTLLHVDELQQLNEWDHALSRFSFHMIYNDSTAVYLTGLVSPSTVGWDDYSRSTSFIPVEYVLELTREYLEKHDVTFLTKDDNGMYTIPLATFDDDIVLYNITSEWACAEKIPPKTVETLQTDIVMLLNWIDGLIDHIDANDLTVSYLMCLIKTLDVVNNESFIINETTERLLDTIQQRFKIEGGDQDDK